MSSLSAPEHPTSAGTRPPQMGSAPRRGDPGLSTYTVAVRALCEFAAKQGDLDLRFTPSPTSQQGVNGHQTVAASRSASYRSEVSC